MQPISLFSLVAFAATASASTINLRGDAQYAHQTCGVNGATNTLDHDDIQSATDAFGAWLDDGADGQLSANGNFKGSLGVCDYLIGSLRKTKSLDAAELTRQCRKPRAR